MSKPSDYAGYTSLYAGLLAGLVLGLITPATAQDPPAGAAFVQDVARQRGTVRVIATVRGALPAAALESAETLDRKSRLTATLQATNAPRIEPLPNLPFIVAEVDEAGLQRLIESGEIVSVQEDIPQPPLLPQSGPLVNAPNAWAQGARGAGAAVAIIDTGVDSAHPFLTGRVIAEACFSTNSPGQGSTTLCPNGSNQQIGPGAGRACTFGGCYHGTHVAGIAAGRGTDFSGMAPDANIVAIQVFSRFEDRQGGPTPCLNAGTSSPCVLAFISDQIRALGHVSDIAIARSIAAANMSLGGGRFTAPCDTDARRPVIQALRGLGTATVVSSGNDGYTDAVGSPACVPEAVTIGSTTKADAVSSFSDSASMVDLLAPGSDIYSSLPGATFGTLSGTSMAAPHVAGAFAALRSACWHASVDSAEVALKTSGQMITDTRNGLRFPRIDIPAALALLPQHRGQFALYRPGTGTIWLLQKDAAGAFYPVYKQGDPGLGVGGYDLKSPADRAFMLDYDSKGKPDHLVLYRPGTGTMWILKHDTCAGFTPVYRQGDPGNGIGGYDLKSPADLAFAFDYNSSGKSDHVVLYRPGTGTMWILKRDGPGQFNPVYQQGDPGSGIGGYDLKSGADRAFAFDYNSSGKLDHIALYRPGTGTIWILNKNAAGTFSAVYKQGAPGNGIGGYDLNSPADHVFAFDYNSSGKLDHLALYRPATGTIWILRNQGGTFTPVYKQGDPGNGIGGYDLKSLVDRAFAVDYDGSGKFDHLALYRPATGTMWVLRNQAGTFTPVYKQGDPGNGIGGYDLKSPADRAFAVHAP